MSKTVLMSLIENIDTARLPEHIAIIMDGNGRWAKLHGKNRVFGHKNGVKSVRESVETAAELGVKYLTLYAFSTENWSRPKPEITALTNLLISTIRKETSRLMENNIRLLTIGDQSGFSKRSQRELEEAKEMTAGNTRMTLILALGYSARWEITNAMQQVAEQVSNGELDPGAINEQTVSNNLSTAGLPDPELLIRTSGELRISNYLLWQIAYTELYFTETLWPDFRKENLYEAIIDYQQRERRFGKISEQVNIK
jgi:undecaprenyl diphosphate synthase